MKLFTFPNNPVFCGSVVSAMSWRGMIQQFSLCFSGTQPRKVEVFLAKSTLLHFQKIKKPQTLYIAAMSNQQSTYQWKERGREEERERDCYVACWHFYPISIKTRSSSQYMDISTLRLYQSERGWVGTTQRGLRDSPTHSGMMKDASSNRIHCKSSWHCIQEYLHNIWVRLSRVQMGDSTESHGE